MQSDKDGKKAATKNDLRNLERAIERKFDAAIDKMLNIFVTKKEFNELKEKVETQGETQRKILSAVESFASMKDTKTLEDAARDAQLSRHDGWIKQIAQEASVTLKN